MPAPTFDSTPRGILHWARHTPNAVAVIEGDRDHSYGDLAATVVRYTKALTASGVRPGMLVGIECGYRYLHMALIMACELIGAASLSLSEQDARAPDSGMERCDFLCLETAGIEPGACVGLLPINQDSIDRIAAIRCDIADFALLDRRPPDNAVLRLVKTSGTATGRPKIMAMTHRLTEILIDRTQMFHDDSGHAWNLVNLYSFTLRSAWMESAVALRHGRTIVSATLPTVFDALRRFDSARLTATSGDAVRIARSIPPDWPGRRPCAMIVKGGMLQAGVRACLAERVVERLHNEYAMLECFRIAWQDADGVGTLHPDASVRVLRDDGTEAAMGEVGRLDVRSAMMVDGYLWDEQATRQAFRDGWYRTGDLGYLSTPHTLHVLGRADDMLNLGGNKLSPIPMEQAMRDLDGVEDAVLIVAPAGDGADMLYVVLEAAHPDTAERLKPRLIEILSGYTEVFRTLVLPQLPRTDTGKPRRTALREQLSA